MMANNLGFKPAMILDPVTMTPMMSGGSITVNPLGMAGMHFTERASFAKRNNVVRAEQKPWQKMFIQNIPQEMPDDLVKKILKVVGNLRSFLRSERKGKRLTFAIFEFDSGEDILRAGKFLSGIKILDKTLELKTSDQTENFIKEWMTIQKEEWKKKLLSTGNNEAKEYESLEKYLERDDKKLAQQLQAVISSVNSELRKLIHQKMREDERKEHPKEKERDKRKRQFKEELDRKYNQRHEYWIGREKDKQRQYKKQREKERDREKAKVRRLEREMDIDSDEESRRIAKFLNPDRKKLREKELAIDAEKELEWKPPEPAVLIEFNAPEQPEPEDAEEDAKPTRPRITYNTMEEEIQRGVDSSKAQQPLLVVQGIRKQQQIRTSKPSGMFVQEEEHHEVVKKGYELNLPKVNEQEIKKEQEENKAIQVELQRKLAELFKQVPQTKEQLWSYPIDWQMLSKSVIIQRKIRPWLNKKSIQYMGEVEDNFINVIESRLVKSSGPQKIVRKLSQLLDDQAEDFVIKLWKVLIFELIKMKNGIAP